MSKKKSIILVVDDDPQARRFLVRALEIILGVDCCQASNGAQAIVMYQKLHIDLVITDYDMPDMNGLEFIDWLRANDKNACVIMATGNTDECVEKKALSAGVLKFLKKPYPLDDLLDIVRQIQGE